MYKNFDFTIKNSRCVFGNLDGSDRDKLGELCLSVCARHKYDRLGLTSYSGVQP